MQAMNMHWFYVLYETIVVANKFRRDMSTKKEKTEVG
jgi:hypothetical protein